MKDRFAELVFEEEDLAADCGLGNVKLLTCCSEGSGLRDRPDDFQLPEVHESAYMRARHESTCDDSLVRWGLEDRGRRGFARWPHSCLLYTSDAADERSS